MPDGAIMANSGHFDAELELKALSELAEGHVRDVRENVQEYDLGGKRLFVIAEGRLVNLGAAEGHPAAVMDMSFAAQALAAEYVAKEHGSLQPGVYVVPDQLDREVARLKLEALGIHIDDMTPSRCATSAPGRKAPDRGAPAAPAGPGPGAGASGLGRAVAHRAVGGGAVQGVEELATGPPCQRVAVTHPPLLMRDHPPQLRVEFPEHLAAPVPAGEVGDEAA